MSYTTLKKLALQRKNIQNEGVQIGNCRQTKRETSIQNKSIMSGKPHNTNSK